MNMFFKHLNGIGNTEKYILLGLFTISTILAILFWNFGLTVYDMPGHVSLVWYLKEYLWPSPAGWNSFFLAGFPQGVFYPSLFHWLAAAISSVIGVDAAVKLLVSLALLTAPFTIYFAVRNTVSNSRYHFIFTLLILLLLSALPNFLGVGPRGLFQIGLIPNFVSTPLFFLFVGLLHSESKQSKTLLLTLVWSSLILTHIVAAAVAAIYFFIYVAVLCWQKRLKFILFIWLMIVVSAITAFFWAPFWLNFSFTSISVHTSSYFTVNLVLALSALGFLVYSLRSSSHPAFPLLAFSFVVLVLATVDSLLIRIGARSAWAGALYSLHFYRFQPYAYSALILAAGSMVANSKLIYIQKYVQSVSIGLFLIFAGYLFIKTPLVPDSKITLEDTKLGGRFIESFRRTESSPLVYAAQTNLVMQHPQENQWAYGLFTDSTPNGPYLGSLIRSLRPEAYPEGEGEFIETKLINEKNIKHALGLFGIKYILDLGESEIGKEIGSWKSGNKEKIYSVRQIGSGTLAEISPFNPVPTGGDFDKKVVEWWDQDREWVNLPFEVKEEIPGLDPSKFDPKTEVNITKHDDTWTQFTLNIKATEPQPVLVKFSYFPWWFAQQNGKEIQIYRTAPNLMLIFANGEVDFEFKEPIWLIIPYLISIVSLLIVFFRIFKKNWHKPIS